MQIAIVDVISLVQIKFEMFYVTNGMWIEEPEMCPMYLGLDAFTNSAVIFFIITLNLHSVSTYNLARKTLAKRAAKLLQEKEYEAQYGTEEEETDAFVDNMVQRNQRSITIDYTKQKSHVAVLVPITIVWLLAVSLAIPMLSYGTVLPSRQNPKVCGVVEFDRENSLLLQVLLIKMRVVVPLLCLVISSIYVILKLVHVKRTIKPCGLEEDVVKILKLALTLSLTYLLFSMQRLIGSLYFELISRPLMEPKYPQFEKWTAVGGCILHFAAPIIRPIIYCYFDKSCRICCRRRKN